MNTRDDKFPEVLEVWLSEGSDQEDPYRIMDRALARVDATAQSRFGWLSGVLGFLDSTVRVAIASMAVAAVAVVGVALFSSGNFPGGPGPQASPTASQASAAPSQPAPTNVVGLPPVGATPSDTTLSQPVVRFASSSPSTTVWIYADGRFISSPFLSTPAGVGHAYTGLVEQRLSVDGVAFLLAEVASTGLFEDDLFLARETSGGFLEVALRRGDRFVRVDWSWPGESGAPVATAEQAAAMESINDLFRDPSTWPADAWEDDAVTAWVPSNYAVCIGVKPEGAGPGEWIGSVEPVDAWALLPASAQELLRGGEVFPDANNPKMHADAGCTQLTTDDARALALSLEAGGITRHLPESAKYFVAFVMTDPIPAWDWVYIQFGPVLPDGQATYGGPG